MKKLVVVVAVISVVALAALAYGEMGGHGMGRGMMGGPGAGCGMMGGMDGRMMGGEHQMWNFLTGLTLDEQQKAAVAAIRSRTEKESIRRMADMRIAHIELKDLLSKDPVDMKAVEAKVKQSETLRTEMHLSHLKAMEEVKASLTPEQKKKFHEMVAAGPAMRGKGMSRCKDCPMAKD
jgi:Spy/CpxP family protein refolding chaperone